MGNSEDIFYVVADPSVRFRIREEQPFWARYLCAEDGFTVTAMDRDRLVGVISVEWRDLPAPLPPTREGYINILEVVEGHRRKGIGRKLVEMSLARAKAAGATQLRSWSTNDKEEAIPLWKALGFGLCPMTHSMWKAEITGYFVAKRVDEG